MELLLPEAPPREKNQAEASSLGSMPAPVGGQLGAHRTQDGIRFGVWAPHAEAVWVKGDFNGWKDDDIPMERDEAGNWWATVKGVTTGAQYLYRLKTSEGLVDRVDPRARQVTNSVGNGVVVDPEVFDWEDDAAFQTPDHHSLVIYELHTGSFSPPDEHRPGGFDEVVQRLPYLKRLGVNAIQLMPVAEFAGDRSWGYNPAHPFAVESAYGGPEALRRLVKAAHADGIAVILDVVYNHFGPSDLQLWRFDGWSESHDGVEGGGIYFYNDHRARTPWGDTRPDYGRGEVRQYIRDNVMMWLEEFHLDGLRMDMTLYMRSVGGNGGDDLPEGWSLMQWLTSEVRAHRPRAIVISEDLRELPQLTAPPAEGGAGFHAQWDARFVHPVRAAITAINDAERSVPAVASAVATIDHGNAFARVVYTESHDETANGRARVPHEIAGDNLDDWFAQKRSTLGAALVFTAPGIPMLLQGQEFLQGQWFRDDLPLDWDQSSTYRGIVRLYRDLIRLRRNLDGRTVGLMGHGMAILHANDEAKLLAFHRWAQHGPGDDVVVVANLCVEERQDYRIGLPAAGRWEVVFNSDSLAYGKSFWDAGSGEVYASPEPYDGQSASALVGVSPYSLVILSWAG